MTIQANAKRLSGWLHSQHITAATAKRADLTQASTALGLSKTDVDDARRFLLDQAFARNEAGQSAGDLTGRGQVRASFGQLDSTQSAALVARGQKRNDPKLAAFEASTYSLHDVRELMKKEGLNADGAKKLIGEKILNHQEAELRQIGLGPDHVGHDELREMTTRSGDSEADAKVALAASTMPSSEEAERIQSAATTVGWGGSGHGFLWMDSHKNDAAFGQFLQQLQQSDPSAQVLRLLAQSPQELVRLTQDLAKGPASSKVVWLDTRPHPPDEIRAWKEAWLTSYNCLNGLDNQSLPARFLLMVVPPEVSGPELNHAAVDFWSKRNSF